MTKSRQKMSDKEHEAQDRDKLREVVETKEGVGCCEGKRAEEMRGEEKWERVKKGGSSRLLVLSTPSKSKRWWLKLR